VQKKAVQTQEDEMLWPGEGGAVLEQALGAASPEPPPFCTGPMLSESTNLTAPPLSPPIFFSERKLLSSKSICIDLCLTSVYVLMQILKGEGMSCLEICLQKGYRPECHKYGIVFSFSDFQSKIL